MIARDIVFQPENSIDVEPGAVTLWDLSRYPNDGAMTNVTWVQLPSSLWVMVFNGTTSWVNCGADASVRSFRYSHEFWLNPTTIAPVTQGLIGIHWAGDGVYIHMRGDEIRLTHGGIAEFTTATLNLQIDTWYHMVALYDGTDIMLYVNGAFIQSVGTAAPTWAGAAELVYGTWRNSNLGTNSIYFEGNIVPNYYNYALTAGQVRNYFEKTKHWFGVHD